MTKANVMLVEDDATVRLVVADFLRANDYTVIHFEDGTSARKALRASIPDLLILDRMLPGISGDDLCREVRAVSDVPIIMLTALDAVDQRIEGLEHGADDYLSKPFALRELLLRVNSALRRRQSKSVTLEPFVLGPFHVDPTHRQIRKELREIQLTAREYELFMFFLLRPDQVVSREDILRESWGWDFGDASTVTVNVRRLREKIEPDPRYPIHLLTEWGVGYRFTVKGGSADAGTL